MCLLYVFRINQNNKYYRKEKLKGKKEDIGPAWTQLVGGCGAYRWQSLCDEGLMMHLRGGVAQPR